MTAQAPPSDVGFSKIGMLGVGSMGSMMTLLFAERGYHVFFYDPSKSNMETLEKQGDHDLGMHDKVTRCTSYKEVCQQIKDEGKPRVFVLSIPHGKPADQCVDAIQGHMDEGDIIVDCGNEHWTNTERRQKALEEKRIHYVGCGVSGGYQSARHGPSMSPGGTKEALEKVMPFLKSVAAKDKKGTPCTVEVGPGGSGHYVKMVHNGIEQGMMSVVAEVWMLLTTGLGLAAGEVAAVFRKWNEEGPLKDCFLIAIGVDIENTKGEDGQFVLDSVRDKVVQDVDEEEGTGTWTCEEAINLHVPAPSILSAHMFRCASADLAMRIANRKAAHSHIDAQELKGVEKEKFIDKLHGTTYFCFLACFAQGMDIIGAKARKEGWKLDYPSIMQLWRGGCIIQADHITSLLASVYKGSDYDDHDLLANKEIGEELSKEFPAAKEVVLKGIEHDAFVPAISQCVEYFKYETSTRLPTQFMEAQLDYFGQHMFDAKSDPIKEGVEKGKRHFEWKPAKGVTGK